MSEKSVAVSPELISAYRAASYEVVAGETVIRIRVDQACPGLENLLHAYGAATAALITAYNPRSRKQSAEDNAKSHVALLDAVESMGQEHLPSRGCDPEGQWPTEEGLLIFGISRGEALELARRFDQYAIVWIEDKRPSALVLTDQI